MKTSDAFREGQTPGAQETSGLDLLIRELSSLQCFLPRGTEIGLQVALKITNLIGSHNKV